MNVSVMAKPLVAETRAGLAECIHHGMISVVKKETLVTAVGNPDWMCYYRSAAKPIQSLPIYLYHLDRKYGLTAEETAFFSGSHWGDEEHERVCRSIMQKADIYPDDMIMQPVYPQRTKRREALLRAGLPPQKIYHNCAGKHLALMLLARELKEPQQEYWKQDSRTQETVREIIAEMSGVEYAAVAVGVDGCGVPVYAVPFSGLARAYEKLACPEEIRDESLRIAIETSMRNIHAHPNMIAGRGIIDSILTGNPDLIAKSGAQGVYTIGIRSKKMGIAFKILDGSQDVFACVAVELLTRLGVAAQTVDAVKEVYSDTIVNDQNEPVGNLHLLFDLQTSCDRIDFI